MVIKFKVYSVMDDWMLAVGCWLLGELKTDDPVDGTRPDEVVVEINVYNVFNHKAIGFNIKKML